MQVVSGIWLNIYQTDDAVTDNKNIPLITSATDSSSAFYNEP